MENYLSKIITHKLYLLFFIISFISLLSIYTIKGSYSRYAQDDYCYGYRVRTTGFWNTQIQSYLYKAEYVSDRFSTTLAHSIIEILGGPKFMPFLTSLEILAWLGSLIYILYQLHVIIFARKNILIVLTSAMVILFFTLYLAPEQYQILFWLSAIQTYLTPMVLATFLLADFIKIARLASIKPHHVIALGILCFIASGFSETTALWQFTCWCVILGWSLIFLKKSSFASMKNIAWLSLVTLFSTALALLAMAKSPSNLKSPTWAPPTLSITLVINSFKNGVEYLWTSIKGTPIPFIVVVCFGFLLSSLIPSERNGKPSNYLFEIGAVFFIMYIIAAANMVPIKLAEGASAYPGARSLLPAHLSLVVCLFLTGWIAANFIMALKSKFFSFHLSSILQILLGILLFIYVARTTSHVEGKIQLYEARANAWDIRQQMILNAKADGQVNVTVPEFDSVYGITEIGSNPKNWVNLCAARYYGVNSITAIDHYQGIPAYPIGK